MGLSACMTTDGVLDTLCLKHVTVLRDEFADGQFVLHFVIFLTIEGPR